MKTLGDDIRIAPRPDDPVLRIGDADARRSPVPQTPSVALRPHAAVNVDAIALATEFGRKGRTILPARRVDDPLHIGFPRKDGIVRKQQRQAVLQFRRTRDRRRKPGNEASREQDGR